jgi:hypothetical protein
MGKATGVRFPAGTRIIFLATIFRPPVGPTQPPTERVPGALSPGVKWPGIGADHSPPPSAGVQLHLHSRVSLHSVVFN